MRAVREPRLQKTSVKSIYVQVIGHRHYPDQSQLPEGTARPVILAGNRMSALLCIVISTAQNPAVLLTVSTTGILLESLTMTNRYQAFDPNSTVIGASVQGYVGCIRADEIEKYLMKYNLVQIDPMGWYPLQTLLDLLSDLHEDHQGEAMFDFVSIGMKALEMTPFPPEVEALPFEHIIMAGDNVYKATHQGDAGYVQPQIMGDRHVVQRTRTPYPDDLMYGALYT